MLCDDLGGWVGCGGGMEAQKGGGICVLMANPCCCIEETNTL